MEKEKSQKIQMIYGYAVCLVTVITFLISVTSMVYALMDLTDPINAHRTYGKDAPSLASYENYRVDILKSLDPEHGIELDDATLKSMFTAAKQDAIAKVKHNAYRSVIVNSLVLLICIVLFITHMMWMRKLYRKDT
jgi:hypothetical protein